MSFQLDPKTTIIFSNINSSSLILTDSKGVCLCIQVVLVPLGFLYSD